MGPVFRAFLATITFIATFYFVFWFGGALLVALGMMNARAVGWTMVAGSAVIATLVARFVWRRSASASGLVGSVLRGAFVTGAIGFCIGFFGPIIFTPGANQGPLLGIFITGPLGFVLGAIGGGVRWAARRAREAGPSA